VTVAAINSGGVERPLKAVRTRYLGVTRRSDYGRPDAGVAVFRALEFTLQLLAPTTSKSTAPAARSRDPAADPVGLWAAGKVHRVPLGGGIRVAKSGTAWNLLIVGTTLSAGSRGGDTIAVSFGAERGAFRGHLTPNREELHGFWTQPPLRGESSAYTTPVTLTRVATNVWEGDVRPVQDISSIYVQLRRERSGLVARLRDPGGKTGDGRFTVKQSGNELRFTETGGLARSFSGTLVPREGRLNIALSSSDTSAAWSLQRRARIRAGGFFPRLDTLRYEYRSPRARGDGWRVADATNLGWNVQTWTAMVQRILDVDPGTSREPQVTSIVVAHDGQVVLDEYFYGVLPDMAQPSRIAGRLILAESGPRAALAALDEGIARPMQLSGYALHVSASGGADSTGARVRARDLLKFAQARLDNGTWSNRPVLPERFRQNWTADSVKGRPGRLARESILSDGEALFVIPRLRMAVAMTARPTGDQDAWRRYAEDLLTRHLLPAVRP
jgi:hypothetical protein